MRSQTARNDDIVSFDDEDLILVDSQDNVLGHADKLTCHDGDGQLHRAFSIFLFNGAGQLMLQQRSEQKRLWPGYWANSCCSHPRRGESNLQAARRRVTEELGVSPELTFLFRFEYQVEFLNLGAEHELCSVYATKTDAPVTVNINEVSDWKFVQPDDLDRELADNPQHYSPWLKLEWPRIREQHWYAIQAL